MNDLAECENQREDREPSLFILDVIVVNKQKTMWLDLAQCKNQREDCESCVT